MEKMETIRRLTRWKIARVTLIGLATVAGSNLIAQTEPTATRTFIYSANLVIYSIFSSKDEPEDGGWGFLSRWGSFLVF